MTVVDLETKIDSDINRCFDLSRDIEVHKKSTTGTNEEAIAGKTNGLLELGDKVTWEAKHFGIRQQLSVEITKLTKPYFFEDRMTKGAFKSMRHEHHFKSINGGTLMIDKFEYEVPYGFLGWIFNKILLQKYMVRFLQERNRIIKQKAENRLP